MLENRLKELRKKLQFSQEDMAQKMDVSYRAYSSYERGERKIPIELLSFLAEKYNANLNYLISNIGEMFIYNCENTHAVIKNNKPILNFQDWGNRLNKILAENELTLHDFSKKTGIKEHRLEDFVLNSAEPTMSEINLIKSNIDISIDELFYGETIENKQAKKSTPIQLSADEIIKIKKLLEISNL